MQLDVEESTPASDMTYWFHFRIAIGTGIGAGYMVMNHPQRILTEMSFIFESAFEKKIVK